MTPLVARRWARLALLIGAVGASCTAINDADDFVIEPEGMVDPNPPPEGADCRVAGVASRCGEGNVPQSCSATGVWEDTGPACALGCSDGVCYECAPGTGMCFDDERVRLRCSDAGRWVNAEPCALAAPHCVEGECLECSPLERTCIGSVPHTCGPDGRWRAEAACPEGQACVPETGECLACGRDEVRACRGARGNCAQGLSTCQADGSWSPCSITPEEDRCEPLGDDANCDGVPNSPAAGCEVGCSADVGCGPLENVGICRTGVSRCVDGVFQACEGAVWPEPRDCRSRDDNDCNGVPDYQDDTCACDATSDTPQPCPASPYGDEGICERQVRSCLVAPGGTTSYWGACWGGVPPRARDCRSSDDNDCDGTPDDGSPECECALGTSQACTAGGCSGLRRCSMTPSAEATYWGECELSSEWLFAEPELVGGLGVAGDLWGPALSPDGERLVFSAGDPEHIYVAERSGAGAFGAASLLSGVNGATTEGTPFITASGQALYFDSRRRSGGGRDLHRATAEGSGWGSAALVPNVNSSSDDLNPWVSPDERLLVFNSDRGGDMDLWAAVWSEGEFRAPAALDALNSSASDEGATLTRDGLTVFFASNRAGGSGGLDLWVATRQGLDAAFSAPRPLRGVNTDADELDPALASEGRELFFASSRGGAYQLYRAERGCDPSAAAGAVLD